MLAMAYILKVILALWWSDIRGSSASTWEFICPLACLMGIGLVAFTLWLTIVFIRRDQNGLPTLALWCGLIISVIAPLPPLPPPAFPEEAFFATHRADFEQIVTLARQDQLKCQPNLGCDVMARDLPPEYRSLSLDEYVQVAHDSRSGLTVIFRPISFDYSVIYFDNPEGRNSLTSSICPVESRFTRILETHWYVCGNEGD